MSRREKGGINREGRKVYTSIYGTNEINRVLTFDDDEDDDGAMLAFALTAAAETSFKNCNS